MTDDIITIRTIKQACKQYDAYKQHGIRYTLDLTDVMRNYARQHINENSLNESKRYIPSSVDMIQNKSFSVMSDTISKLMNDNDYVSKLTAYGSCLIALDILHGILLDYSTDDDYHAHNTHCPYKHENSLTMTTNHASEFYYLCNHKSTIMKTAKLVLEGYPDEYIHENIKTMIEQIVRD